MEANIDSVALQVCLNLLFTAMGIDTYTALLELLPLAQNDVVSIPREIAHLDRSD